MGDKLQVAVGYWILNGEKQYERKRLQKLLSHRDEIFDLHFSHYDPNICSSGRYPLHDKKKLMEFIEMNQEEFGFPITLLLNYMLHKDYDLVLKNFKEEFYSRGIRSVVISDLELIKRMKQAFPDVHIMGSCLSYRMTEDELYEEAKEGVEIHNPAVDIIRDYKQLIANHKAGFKQKVIFAEGCMHKCPHEKPEGGHRWATARNIKWGDQTDCVHLFQRNYLNFYRANWVTIERLKQLREYIEVVKLPRHANSKMDHDLLRYPLEEDIDSLHLRSIDDFFDIYHNDQDYNIMHYVGVAWARTFRIIYKRIPSSYFTNEFFDKVAYCNMQCEKLNCHICHGIQKRIERNMLTEEFRNDNIYMRNI